MLAVRLSKEKKKRWEDYVEASNQPTLSQLVRIATEREIARESPLEKVDSESQEPAPEVTDKLEQISHKLQSVDRRLSAIESERYGDEDLTKLATEIYDILPSSIVEIQSAVAQNENPSPVNESQSSREYMIEAMGGDKQETASTSQGHEPPENPACTGSITNLATILDADEEAVQLALKRLQSTTYSVSSIESEAGTTQYYKND
jgi:uncharacterized protein YfkK (UPF0435 family)